MSKIQEVEVANSDSLDLNRQIDRDELLYEHEIESKRVKNISFSNLIWLFIAIALVLLIALPKIYISNHIYFFSKEINELYHQYTALKEERSHLKRELELLRYKVEVIDDMQ